MLAKKDMFYHVISILARKFHVGFGEGMLCIYIHIHDSSITAPFSLRSCWSHHTEPQTIPIPKFLPTFVGKNKSKVHQPTWTQIAQWNGCGHPEIGEQLGWSPNSAETLQSRGELPKPWPTVMFTVGRPGAKIRLQRWWCVWERKVEAEKSAEHLAFPAGDQDWIAEYFVGYVWMCARAGGFDSDSCWAQHGWSEDALRLLAVIAVGKAMAATAS